MNKQDRSAKELLIASILEEVSLKSNTPINEVRNIILQQELGKNKINEQEKQLDKKLATETRIENKRIDNIGIIPINIVNHPTLSPLEAIVKYLKEEKSMRLHDIAVLCRRDERAIGVTYWRAIKKAPQRFSSITNITRKSPMFPVTVLRNDNLSVLEHIVVYILDKYCLRLCDVAALLGKDDRTIWTIKERALKKLNSKSEVKK
jgi:hypothetical protein